MYFNLKDEGSNLKGEVAEVIAKNKIKNCFRTKEVSKEIIDKLGFKIKPEIKEFLEKYWYSLDLFRFVLNEKEIAVNLELFEVKSQNFYSKKLKRVYYLLNLTKKTSEIYKEAKEKGFIVKLVKVIFFYNWKYCVRIKDFELEDFVINDGSESFIKKFLRKK